MNEDKTGIRHELDPELEQKLSETMKALSSHSAVDVPGEVDAVVMSVIRSKAQQIRIRRKDKPVFRMLRYAAAAAAVVVVLVGIRSMVDRTVTPEPIASSPGHHVDIVDAYLLAMKLEAGAKVSGNYDFNRDGTVDRADVERVAAMAVALNPAEDGGA